MIIDKLSNLINNQINKEFYSGYLYLSMSAYLKELNMHGLSNLFREKTKIKVEHGLKMFDYLVNNSSLVRLKQIKTANNIKDDISAILNTIYECECSITNDINKIAQIAEKVEDLSTLNFICYFLRIQINDENNIKNIIDRLNLCGDANLALLIMDKEYCKKFA